MRSRRRNDRCSFSTPKATEARLLARSALCDGRTHCMSNTCSCQASRRSSASRRPSSWSPSAAMKLRLFRVLSSARPAGLLLCVLLYLWLIVRCSDGLDDHALIPGLSASSPVTMHTKPELVCLFCCFLNSFSIACSERRHFADGRAAS